MNNGFGFGFSFPNSGDDDNNGDENSRNQNPMGGFGFGTGSGGGLGDMLGQFGAMLSGMGSSMNNPENSGPVNFDLAKRVATQALTATSAPSADETRAVEESVRLADLWINDATPLPSAAQRIQAWSPNDWLEETLPVWKRLVEPVASHMNSAQMDSLPEEARDMMGPMSAMMAQMNGMNTGMQLGGALGSLAKQALTGCDFGLPVAPSGTVAILPGAVHSISKGTEIPQQEIMVYIAAREAARQRLFTNVPWLTERLISSIEEYAMGLVIDTSHIEEATRELNLESGNPADIQAAMSQLQGMDLSPRITSRNAQAMARLETLLALIEGWVDVVVEDSLGERIPSVPALSAAWNRRTESGGNAQNALSKVVSIEINTPRIAQAAQLWRRSTMAVGAQKRDSVWDHPDLLPTSEHLDNPAAFIDGLLDDSPSDEFEQEFAKLEEMLRGEEPGEEPGSQSPEEEDGTAQ